MQDGRSTFSLFWTTLVTIKLIFLRIIQNILACLHTARRKTRKVTTSRWLSLLGPARCTSSISPSSSLGRHIQNCRPFELLVDKCEDPAMLFLTTGPQGHLRFQDGGWANWASWGRLHGCRIILAPGSSFLSQRIILAVGSS